MNFDMMHMRFLLLSIVLMFFYSSCIENPFDDTEYGVYPDTTVMINSLIPQICEVKISYSDTLYDVTAYWTDKQTGRIIYKMEEGAYKNGQLHGVKYEFDQDGDTILIAHFDNGIRVDSTVYYYHNGSPKHKYFYSDAKNGNIIFEIQYHENGHKKTDMVAYEDGQLNGAVHYYDDSKKQKRTETYFYRENELIGIKIYNERYAALDRRKDYLLKQYQADSARIAESLLASNHLDNEGSVPVFYSGGMDDDFAEPDNWDIMKIDPAFMLKYYNR